MTEHHDTVVIGAGHNGLVCAATLAAAGQRVLVLEAAAQPGGAARTREFAPGFSVSAGAHLLHWMPRALMDEMKLARHGLRFAASGLGTVMLGGAGGSLRLDGAWATGDGLGEADVTAYADFRKETLGYARILAQAFARRPPRLVDADWHDRLGLLRLGWGLRALGRERMRELLRIGLMNIYDLANERFADPRLRAAVALDAVLGAAMGPRSPNTVMSYLYRRTGETFGHVGAALPAGGMGALAAALAAEARARGVEIRTGARVAGIDTDAGRVSGVRLASGERIDAARVISNADPRTTMRTLVGYRHLDAGFVRRIEGIRMRGTAAKLHLALDALPVFRGLDDAALGQRLLLGGDMDAIELAFNPCKYRECSAEPVLEFCIPTLHDPMLAPVGKHVLSAIVQYVPSDPVGGWNAGSRAELLARVMAQLERVAPGIGTLVSASELLTPADLEAEFGMCGGHWHHGEISVDQLLMLRPVPLAAQYAMPVEGLWLCGAGTHPGGGIMGLAGRNCAREILRRRSRP
jgi:phytoene dehydrogenase-like protein